MDCNSIIFEYYQADSYSLSSYYCPHAQEYVLPYKQAVVSTVAYLDTALNLDTLYDQFMDALPRGRSYTYNGFMNTYLLTSSKREYWEKNKPLRNYLKSIKDTVDTQLRAIFEKPGLRPNDIYCFKDYRVIIGTNGKLKKIYLSQSDIPHLKDEPNLHYYLADLKEIRKCKRLIRRTFRLLDLSALNLKAETRRKISFGIYGNGEVWDETIY